MAAGKYTTRSSASCAIPDAAASSLELDLPDAAEFRPLPPRCSLAQLIQRSRQLRRWFPSGLRPAAERWQAKTTVEFHLGAPSPASSIAPRAVKLPL